MTEKILLIKPQKFNSYTRRLSMSYGHNNLLSLVNKQDKIVAVGIENTVAIQEYKSLPDVLKKEYDKNKRVPDDDTLMTVYQAKKVLRLDVPYKLVKPCKNIRHTTARETKDLLYNLYEQLGEDYLSVKINDKEIKINIRNDNYKPMSSYSDDDATGQTKLF